MSTALVTETTLRIPGDLFRSVDPHLFTYPAVTAEQHSTEFGDCFAVTARVEGIAEPCDLLYSIDATFDEVQAAADAFNADPFAGWAQLLQEFFQAQRERNAAARAALDADARFLEGLEEEFLG